MYYPCIENKDADQLRGYREADLRLCFRQCKLLVFSRTGSHRFFLFVNNEKFQWKIFDIFNIVVQNIDCGYTLD